MEASKLYRVIGTLICYNDDGCRKTDPETVLVDEVVETVRGASGAKLAACSIALCRHHKNAGYWDESPVVIEFIEEKPKEIPPDQVMQALGEMIAPRLPGM